MREACAGKRQDTREHTAWSKRKSARWVLGHRGSNTFGAMAGKEEEVLVGGRRVTTNSYVNDHWLLPCLGTAARSLLLEAHSPWLP